MDRIKALDVFVKVVDTSSFTRAAELSELPRSTVSAVVAQLERDLGVRLLHRSTRRVSPTADGEALLERARQLLVDVDEMESMFRFDGGGVAGRLKIDVPSRIATRLIAPALPDFFRRYPEVELLIGVTDRAIDLVQDGVDCAIRVGTGESSSLIARSLGEFEIINCASPAYLAEHGVPASPGDLARHWIVNYLSASSGRVVPWEYRDGAELKTVAARSHVTVNQADTYIACAVAGMGLIQVPAYDVRHHVQAGELQEVMPQWRADPMPIAALYPHRRQLSPRVRVFIAWMKELLQAI
ncbi:LysR family transcriptional regulator [Janthinobacterium sp. BJB412]|nr:LysR family transcriptional regulator [Janthinobacterium sp. BJB412]